MSPVACLLDIGFAQAGSVMEGSEETDIGLPLLMTRERVGKVTGPNYTRKPASGSRVEVVDVMELVIVSLNILPDPDHAKVTDMSQNAPLDVQHGVSDHH
jgi:hypothetical protein